MMNYTDTKDFELAAQEMAMHMAMCVTSEYCNSWGVLDTLQKLEEYIDDPDLGLAIEAVRESYAC
jgi:hypothetical protein